MRERLYRSREDRMLFGVAGGMAEWMDLDPAVVRLVWALLILAGGVGLLLYIVAALVIPESPVGSAGVAGQADGETGRAPRAARRENGRGVGMLFGIVLVIAGVWFLVDRYIDIDTSWLIPGLLIVIGLALLLGAVGRSRGEGA
ncbi:MAG TPA: PspC domain-containing protein [Nonomuraea sp.]|nr:PspC domain-containing protein [Nonomuraea sp.]